MHETFPSYNLPPNHEILSPSRDMQFAVNAVCVIGERMVQGRAEGLEVSAKLDRTLVSNMDIETNIWFNEQVSEQYGGTAHVRAEEVSQQASAPTPEGEETVTFVLDSIDGTGEYVATHRDARTGEPINPTRPVPAGADIEPIPDDERTTCTGLAMMRGDKLWLAAVYNPFKKQLVIADRDLGGSFIIDQQGLEAGIIAGRRLHVSRRPFAPGMPPWDSAVWEGAAVDTAKLETGAGAAPLGHYSAIDQAVTVALGESVGAVFAGDTIHDILPAAAIVHGAGGLLMKPDGTPVHPDTIASQLEGGMVYTNVLGSPAFMHALQTGERTSRSLVDHAGIRFEATWPQITDGIAFDDQPEAIVNFSENNDGETQPDKIVVRPFGYQRGNFLRRSEIRKVKKATRELGAPRWRYRNGMHVNGRSMVGIATIRHPEQSITIGTGENQRTVQASDLILQALRLAVEVKIRAGAHALQTRLEHG